MGCDVVETNTFGGTSLVLREFELEVAGSPKSKSRRDGSRQFDEEQAAAALFEGGVDSLLIETAQDLFTGQSGRS